MANNAYVDRLSYEIMSRMNAGYVDRVAIEVLSIATAGYVQGVSYQLLVRDSNQAVQVPDQPFLQVHEY